MKKNNIVSLFSLSVITLGVTSLLSTKVSVAFENNEANIGSQFSIDSAFKEVVTEESKKIALDREISISKENGKIILSNVDEIYKEGIDISNGEDDGISISNVDDNDNQILFVQKTAYNDITWQQTIQSSNVDYEAIAHFLNKGFSVDKSVFEDGNNMLLLGAMQQREGLVNFAINNGANLDYANKAGQNAYHWAANGHNLLIIKNLLEHKHSNDVINKSDTNGKTPLHLAALNSNTEIVDLLLKNKANINATDQDGRSPLFYALVSEKYEIATMLIKNGSDLALKDKNGTSIEELILNSNINMFQLSFSLLPKITQDKIMVSLKDAPQISYKLVNPTFSYDKIEHMQKNGISPDEDVIL